MDFEDTPEEAAFRAETNGVGLAMDAPAVRTQRSDQSLRENP